jgi:hypothetical protein
MRYKESRSEKDKLLAMGRVVLWPLIESATKLKHKQK